MLMKKAMKKAKVCGLASVVLGMGAGAAWADEMTVQNDSLGPGDNATVCPCFVAGEEAAVWLTSPCDGNIVAFQIFWRSLLGGSPVSLEDSIVVYEGGSFPNPGAVKEELLAPALQDGGLNEFRFQDENQTVPISVPVTAGEEFVVSLGFFNNSSITGPSILFDDSGITPNKNAVRTSSGGWQSAESLGVTGDWIIRAVIDCTGETVGSACLQDGSCVENVTEEEAIMLGGVWGGSGSDCASNQCLGACFVPATEQCVQFDKFTCDIVGGDWQGPGTEDCAAPCVPDLNMDGMLDFFDVSAFLTAFGASDSSADFTGDGEFDFFDVSAFLTAFGAGCP